MIATSGEVAETVREAYRRDGVVQLKVPEAVRELQSEFLRECCAWLDRFAAVNVTPQRLPDVLPTIERSTVGRLYKVSRRFSAAKQLASHQWFCHVAARLMETNLVSCCHFVNIRMDLPREQTYLLPVHQDFPFIQGSYNGITVWLPLHDTPLLVGPPAWIPGSHRGGVRAVREQRYGSGPVPSGGRSFEIAVPGDYADSAFTSVDVPFGSALILSTLVLHRSQPNRSQIARVNLQLRYDDALAQESFERNYPEGLYLGDALGTTYPEYVLGA